MVCGLGKRSCLLEELVREDVRVFGVYVYVCFSDVNVYVFFFSNNG